MINTTEEGLKNYMIIMFFSFSKKLRRGRCWAVSRMICFDFALPFSRKLKSDELVLFMLLNECVVTFDLSLYDLTRSVGLTQFFCFSINIIAFAKGYMSDN